MGRNRCPLPRESARLPPPFFASIKSIYSQFLTHSMGKKRFEKIKERRKKIASERIRVLMSLAEESALEGDMEHASRYAFLARKIGMRYNVKMPKGHKLAICRKCGSYILSSRTARFRMTGKRLSRQCLKCGAYYRIPLSGRAQDG